MKSSRSFLYFLIPFLIIAVIVLSAFGRTLGSYFLEDDFGEVLYVSQIFSGNWHKVISNFTGNYMEIPTMKVYRPFLLLSIMADYAVWGTKAFGYFITNISFLIGTGIVLYMVLVELTKSWGKLRSILFALFSATLFASSPLHCESVSLMVGRVDIICAFFYLLSLWSFVRKGNRANFVLTTLGILSFWLALLTKEMAIGLPVVLTSICFLFPSIVMKQEKQTGVFTSEQQKPSLYQRIILALKVSYPLWLSCLLYFIIRYLALGTILGGYVGSVGASQISHICEKWTDLDNLYRIIFPLSAAVFTKNGNFHSILFLVYCAFLAIILMRLIIYKTPSKWFLLLIIWTATTLAPIYQLWGLGLNLEGARFLFFLTIPLSIIFPLLIFAPNTAEDNSSPYQTNTPISILDITDIKILSAGAIALFLLVILDTKIAAKNNIPWVHAGKQTRALLKEGQSLAQSFPSDQKGILLGIPKQIDGAHIIYNGATFNFIMSPPFSKDNNTNKFITFDPICFGDPDSINVTRFKQELSRPNIFNCYVWGAEKMAFEKLVVPPAAQLAQSNPPLNFPLPNQKDIVLPFFWQHGLWQLNSDHVDILHCEKGSGIAIAPVVIDPFAYDYMEVEAAINPSIKPQQISVSWLPNFSNPLKTENIARGFSVYLNDQTKAGTSSEQISRQDVQVLSQSDPSSEYKTYRIPLSKYWRWFTEGQLNQLYLEFPPAQFIAVKKIRLLPSLSLIPKFSIVNLSMDNTGVYENDKEKVIFSIDGHLVDNCTDLKIQLSKPNYFFENFEYGSKDAVLCERIIKDTSNEYSVDKSLFSAPGFYQVRAICINKNGDQEGEWTDPITLKVN